MKCASATAVVATVSLMFALCSCSKHRNGNVIAPGPAMAEPIHFEYAVYLMPASHKVDALAILHEGLGKHPNLKLVDELPEDPRTPFVHAYLQKNVKKEYAPPSVKALQYSGYGISREQGRNCRMSLKLSFWTSVIPKSTSGPHCGMQTNSSRKLPARRVVWCGTRRPERSSLPTPGTRRDCHCGLPGCLMFQVKWLSSPTAKVSR